MTQSMHTVHMSILSTPAPPATIPPHDRTHIYSLGAQGSTPTTSLHHAHPIAIVGMAVNLPGAPDVARLWRVLQEGINTVHEVRPSRVLECLVLTP